MMPLLFYALISVDASFSTVYPTKYAHGFVVLCFVVVMQSFMINSHEVFIHIHQGCFAGTGAIVRLPQCQWSKPDGYGKISQCITTTKHSKAKTVCIFLGIYRKRDPWQVITVVQKYWLSRNIILFDIARDVYATHWRNSAVVLFLITRFDSENPQLRHPYLLKASTLSDLAAAVK